MIGIIYIIGFVLIFALCMIYEDPIKALLEIDLDEKTYNYVDSNYLYIVVIISLTSWLGIGYMIHCYFENNE